MGYDKIPKLFKYTRLEHFPAFPKGDNNEEYVVKEFGEKIRVLRNEIL